MSQVNKNKNKNIKTKPAGLT